MRTKFDCVPPRGWARRSGSYNRQLWLERAAVRMVIDLAGPETGDRLIDLGTGRGGP